MPKVKFTSICWSVQIRIVQASTNEGARKFEFEQLVEANSRWGAADRALDAVWKFRCVRGIADSGPALYVLQPGDLVTVDVPAPLDDE